MLLNREKNQLDLERYPFLLIILQVNILQADSKINKNIQYCFTRRFHGV